MELKPCLFRHEGMLVSIWGSSPSHLAVDRNTTDIQARALLGPELAAITASRHGTKPICPLLSTCLSSINFFSSTSCLCLRLPSFFSNHKPYQLAFILTNDHRSVPGVLITQSQQFYNVLSSLLLFLFHTYTKAHVRKCTREGSGKNLHYIWENFII